MTRYFIHLSNGHALIDREGEAHLDLDSALDAALKTLAEILPGRSATLWRDGGLTVTLVEDGGAEVGRLEVHATLSPTALLSAS